MVAVVDDLMLRVSTGVMPGFVRAETGASRNQGTPSRQTSPNLLEQHFGGATDTARNMIFEDIVDIAVGVWMTLVGYRLVPVPGKPGSDSEAWHAKWGKRFRWLGPTMILIGLLLVFADTMWR